MQMNQNYIHQKGTPWNYSHREHNQNYDRQDKNWTRNTTHHYSQDGRIHEYRQQDHNNTQRTLRTPLYNNRPSYSSFAPQYRDTFEDSSQKQHFDYSGYHTNGAKKL